MTVEPAPRALVWLLLVYGLASLVHFVHNAEYLAYYPNLPSWLSRGQIYAVWLGITAVGVVGYVLHRVGHRLVGLGVVAAYAALGFDGLLHYGRAPFVEHSAAMNFSILFEVAAAAVLLTYVLILMTHHVVERRVLPRPE
jgi:hypothetical protein